jgi:hypothetical protein
MLSRLLFVLITLRVLLPPGICICTWTAPAARLLAVCLATDAPVSAPATEHEDDHAPGCPASIFSTGLGVKPPAGPFVLPPDLAGLVPTDPAATAPGTALPLPLAFPSDCLPPAEGLYLTLCALLL